MANEVINKTNMGATVGEHISAFAQAILRENAPLSGHFRDVSQFATKGLDKITYPGLKGFTVANRAHGSTNESQKLNVFTDSLDLDQNAYLKWVIDGSSEVQSTLDWKMECAKIAAADHADYFEGKLLAKVESVARAVAVTVGATDTDKEVQALVAVRKAYKDAKAKDSEGLWIINTQMEADILSNPSIYANSIFGAPLIQDGKIQKLYGFPVEVKVGATNKVVLVMKSAITYGFQLAPNYKEQADINYGTHGVLCAMDQLFGVGACYVETAAGPNLGKSEVVFKAVVTEA